MKSSLSVYWSTTTWARARSAYVTQLDLEAPAPTFLEWIVGALRDHIDRGPTDRGRAAKNSPTVSEIGGLRRVHRVDEDLLLDIARAQVDDRLHAGRLLSRSAWIQEAVLVAAATVEAAAGELAPAPVRLPTGPAPRRSSHAS